MSKKNQKRHIHRPDSKERFCGTSNGISEDFKLGMGPDYWCKNCWKTKHGIKRAKKLRVFYGGNGR